MLINITTLRERIHGVILNKGEQGHKIEGLENKSPDLIILDRNLKLKKKTKII